MLRLSLLFTLLTAPTLQAGWVTKHPKMSCAFALSGMLVGTAWWLQAPALELPQMDYFQAKGVGPGPRMEDGRYVFRPPLRAEIFAGNWLHHEVASRIKARLLKTDPELKALDEWDRPGFRVPVEKIYFEKVAGEDLAFVIVQGPFVKIASREPLSLTDLNSGRAVEVDFRFVEEITENEGAEISIRMALQRGLEPDSLTVLETVGGFRVYGPLFTQADSFKLGERRGEREK